MTTQERASTLNDIQIWRQQLIRSVLRAVAIVGFPAVVVGSYDAYASRIVWVIPLYVVAYAVAALTTFLRRIPFAFQAGAFLGVVYTMGFVEMASAGLTGDAMLYLVTFPFMAVIFFGRRGGSFALVLITLTMIAFGYFFSTGQLVVPAEKLSNSATLVRWLSSMLSFLMVGFLLVNSQNHLISRLTDALTQSRRLSQEQEQHMTGEQKRREQVQAIIAEYMTFVAAVARGDLTAQLPTDGSNQQDDPLIILGYSLNEMVENLRGMTIQMTDVAQELNTSTARILSATAQQVSEASKQSAAVAQTTTTVDELKTIAAQSVSRAQEVTNASQRTVAVSRTGWQAVEKAIESMSQIKTQVEGIAENILALSEQTQQVGEIIATVNDIAAQSNMLALNASVEAARAGEYGKGFAVVAVEVRNLAEQSRQATAQVKAILSDIQKATNATVMATEEGTKGVDVGVQLTTQAGESIEQLAVIIDESAQAATQMVAGGRQQASGVEQIALAMQNINQATTQSLTSTHQAEKAAQELNDLASNLTRIVEQYQL
ncbi:MAG: methyl-accepting chemotaxis protein [Chloroflexota bacterium]|nr:methyl-accepting chemotaxis protein [Chloroflexota bacterium]